MAYADFVSKIDISKQFNNMQSTVGVPFRGVSNDIDGAIGVKTSGWSLGISDKPGRIIAGQCTVTTAGTPVQLVSESIPCHYVWIGAPTISGSVVNTRPCYVGGAAEQNITVLPSDFNGTYIEINDASKLYVDANVNGERIEYQIFA